MAVAPTSRPGTTGDDADTTGRAGGSTGPDISVVIPAYERAATIDRTLRSVRAQDGCAIEIIVVDDGSSDGTAARAEVHAAQDMRVRVLRQPNAGVSAARNAGARAARGRHLTFLDCDDEVRPGWLAAYVAALDAGADLAFSPGLGRHHDRPDSSWAVVPLGPAFADVEGLFNPGMFALPRTTFIAAGGYAVGMRFSENTELGLRVTAFLRQRGAITTITIPEHFVVIHMAPSNQSRADTPTARFEAALRILDQHAEALARDRRLHSSYWGIAGIAAARLGRPGDARRCFAQALRARPTARNAGRLAISLVPAGRARRWPPVASTA